MENDHYLDSGVRPSLHLGACRDHSHGLLVDDEDAPLHPTRVLVVLPHSVPDHVVQDLCNVKLVSVLI